MGFSGQEHWSELPCPPPGSLPNSGIKPASLTSPCIGRWVPYHLHHLGSPKASVLKIVWKFPDRYLWHESHISACNSLSTTRMRGLTGISNTTSPGLSSLSSAPSPVLPKASPQWPVLVTVLWFCTLIPNSSAGPASFQVFPEPDPSHPRCLVRPPRPHLLKSHPLSPGLLPWSPSRSPCPHPSAAVYSQRSGQSGPVKTLPAACLFSFENPASAPHFSQCEGKRRCKADAALYDPALCFLSSPTSFLIGRCFTAVASWPEPRACLRALEHAAPCTPSPLPLDVHVVIPQPLRSLLKCYFPQTTFSGASS